jgi:hypothetical protein
MRIPLRRLNNTLRIGLPTDYVNKNGLEEGDVAIWIEDELGIRLKFVRVADAPEIPTAGQQQTVAAE